MNAALITWIVLPFYLLIRALIDVLYFGILGDLGYEGAAEFIATPILEGIWLFGTNFPNSLWYTIGTYIAVVIIIALGWSETVADRKRGETDEFPGSNSLHK